MAAALSAAAPLNIGLTGGIGSGKSTVAATLVDCGALLVDTDAIARTLTQAGGLAMPALAAEFGPAAVAPDGALDRAHMRKLAFSDVDVRLKLEAILHPLIGHEALKQANEATSAVVVFDVPLLTEASHWRQRVARVLVVDCSTETQVARVAQRPGWDEKTAHAVVAQQAARRARRALADAVIYNDGISLQQLHQEVRALWSLWTANLRPRTG